MSERVHDSRDEGPAQRQPAAESSPASGQAAALLHLQRTAGNRAVVALQRQGDALAGLREETERHQARQARGPQHRWTAEQFASVLAAMYDTYESNRREHGGPEATKALLIAMIEELIGTFVVLPEGYDSYDAPPVWNNDEAQQASIGPAAPGVRVYGPRAPREDPRRTRIRETLDILTGPTFGALAYTAARARGIDETRARSLGQLTNGIFDVMPAASTRMLRMAGTREEGSPSSEDYHDHLRGQIRSGSRNRGR